MAKQGKFEEAIKCAHEIYSELQQMEALIHIANEFLKIGKSEEANALLMEALECLLKNTNESERSNGLLTIGLNFVKLSYWTLAEKVALDIPKTETRQQCWIELASATLDQEGFEKALSKCHQLQSEEARSFYIKGWVDELSVADANAECLHKALPIMAKDSKSIETLLHKYALKEVFLGKPSPEFIQRMNRTLDIQWALDIVCSLSNNDSLVERNYSNMAEWIQQIDDEDDREQIDLWAKHVVKGKITEEQFNVHVKALKI